jgi:translation initiation factor 2B subunit (eIF-2B alpha/beta/delta family)
LSSFVAALATANARIASLEAELEASQKAYDDVTAAKAVAEKSQKSALAKAKKAERALADANKEHAQREQAVAKHLYTMSSAAESKFFDWSFCFRLLLHWCTHRHLPLFPFSIVQN